MKDNLDTLLEERINTYYSRLVKAFVIDFRKARDKNFAFQYYLNLRESHLTVFQNTFPKSRYIYNVMNNYYRLGQPVKNSIEELKQKLKFWELSEVRTYYDIEEAQIVEKSIQYDLKFRKEMAEEISTYVNENFVPIMINDMEVYEELSQGEELQVLIGEEEDIKSMAVPKSILDRKSKKLLQRQMRELKYHMTSFLNFTNEDFVYFYADRKAKEEFFKYVNYHYKEYVNNVKKDKVEKTLKQGAKETQNTEYTNYRRTAAIYLMLEHFQIDRKAKFSQKSVSRFLEFLTGVKEGNLYERVNEIYNQGYKGSHFDDLRYIRKYFVDLQLPEIVEYIDETTREK
jgi:hypothetical protein